jgi:hypothetical protein
MELLIPGLILVALMVYASTKIKQRAAAAFDAEPIETDVYSIDKPEGFLHVIGSDKHLFEAYSREFGAHEDDGNRRATIEIDVLTDRSFLNDHPVEWDRTGPLRTGRFEREETANDITLNAIYKIVETHDALYRLRFAVIAEHKDEYLDKISDTLDSFTVKTI